MRHCAWNRLWSVAPAHRYGPKPEQPLAALERRAGTGELNAAHLGDVLHGGSEFRSIGPMWLPCWAEDDVGAVGGAAYACVAAFSPPITGNVGRWRQQTVATAPDLSSPYHPATRRDEGDQA
jgi:hypothetical protein